MQDRAYYKQVSKEVALYSRAKYWYGKCFSTFHSPFHRSSSFSSPV